MSLEPSGFKFLEPMISTTHELILHKVSEVVPDLRAVFLFGSQATGKAVTGSNYDLYAFQDQIRTATHTVQQVHCDGIAIKIDILPTAILRTPNFLKGTIDDEIFCSTLVEGQILSDKTRRLASFIEKVAEYPVRLRQSVGLAQLAKFSRALKVVEKAICAENADLFRSYAPKVLEHAVHFIHSQHGRFASRNWLERLGGYDPQTYAVVQQGYAGFATLDLDKRWAVDICDVVDSRISDKTSPIATLLASFEPLEFGDIQRRFPWLDPYDLEILVHRLLRNDNTIASKFDLTKSASVA